MCRGPVHRPAHTFDSQLCIGRISREPIQLLRGSLRNIRVIEGACLAISESIDRLIPTVIRGLARGEGGRTSSNFSERAVMVSSVTLTSNQFAATMSTIL